MLNFLKNLFELYLDSIIFVVALALFVIGGALPIILVIAYNCNWWFLLYLISPMMFAGGFMMLDVIKEIT